MKKKIITHFESGVPDASKDIAAGYALGQDYVDTDTGIKYYQVSDGVWEEYSTTTDLNVKENIISGIVASGTDTYTASYSPTIAYTDGLKVIVRFTNANTGSSTININSLGAKSIVKGVSTALVSGDIVAGATLLLVYNGTNFVAVSGLAVSGGTALKTFTVSYDGSEYYNNQASYLSTVNRFYGTPQARGWNVIMTSDLGATPSIPLNGPGYVLPIQCKLIGAIMQIEYSGTTSRDLELRLDSQEVSTNGTITNSQTLFSDRPNSGGTVSSGSIRSTLIFNIGTQPTLQPRTILTHAVCARTTGSDYAYSIIYVFEEVP